MSQPLESAESFAVIQPSGVFDGSQAIAFRQVIQDHLTRAKLILLDLKEVKFMDSSGLGVIVAAVKTVRAADGKLCLCSANQQVKMLFELTSVDQVLEVFPDRAAFVEAIGA
jgi:anti-anti-sigma factor